MSLTVKSQRTGIKYCYSTIAGKPTNEYFRDKARDYRKKRGIKVYSAELSNADKSAAHRLHATGHSQAAIAKRLNTTCYRVQTALGLR